MNIRALVASFAHPSYTGRNRDPAFVVANVLVVSLAAVGAEAVVPTSGSLLVGLGVVLLAARGYAFPGTPLVVRTVMEQFGRNETLDPSRDERELVRAGVLTGTGGEYRLTDSFVAAWRTRVVGAGPREDDAESLAAALDLDPTTVTVDWRDGRLVAEARGRPFGAWLSRAALVADTAGIAELRRRDPRWDALSPRLRRGVVTTLRLYLDACPVCDGTLTLDCEPSRVDDVGGDVVAMTCVACDARLFESGFDVGVPVDNVSSSVVGH